MVIESRIICKIRAQTSSVLLGQVNLGISVKNTMCIPIILKVEAFGKV